MDLIQKFTAMTHLSMPGIFNVSPEKVKGAQSSRFVEYCYNLETPVTLSFYRDTIKIDRWMHVLYVFEPSPQIFEGKCVCAMYDLSQEVMCRIFAATDGDNLIKAVYVRIYKDLEDLTQDLRAETALIREESSERVSECVSRKQLMMWLV